MLTILFIFPEMNCKKEKIACAFVTYQYYHKQNPKKYAQFDTKTDLAFSEIVVFYCKEIVKKKENKSYSWYESNIHKSFIRKTLGPDCLI